MFTKRLYISFHTDDEELVHQSEKILHMLYGKTEVEFYPCHDDMIKALDDMNQEIRAVILDLDTCRDDMPAILRKLKNKKLRNVIIAGFNRKENGDLMRDFFVHHGNIYFTLLTSSKDLKNKLTYILKVLFRTYTTNLNLDYLIVKIK